MTTLNNKLQLALLKRKKAQNKLEKGFTLVELMIVIVIVGILSAVALPNFLNQTSKARATEAKSAIATAFKNAQVEYHEQGQLADEDCSTKFGLPQDGNWEYTCETNGNIVTISGDNDSAGLSFTDSTLDATTGIVTMGGNGAASVSSGGSGD